MSASDGEARGNSRDGQAADTFYREYARVRRRLIERLCSDNPGHDPEALLRLARGFVDDTLFGRLCELRGLPVAWAGGGCSPRSAWPADLVVSDEHLGELRALARGDAPLDVALLAHCFERSVGDLEALRSGWLGVELPRQRQRRQRRGIYFTPPHITRYMVDAALGGWLARRRETLGVGALPPPEAPDGPGPVRAEAVGLHVAFWTSYRQALASLRVLDPACGAGAFLLAAQDTLRREVCRADAELKRLRGGLLDLPDPGAPSMVPDALHGIDLSGDAVGFCRRAIWLDEARADRPVSALDAAIRVGDSLIADPALSKRAFAWDDRFASKFDVILANPPYDVLAGRETGAADLKARKAYFADHPALRHAAGGKLNLYKLFLCQMIDRLAPGGMLAVICPMALMGDQQARGVRQLLFKRCALVSVDAFPQKDDFERRVFRDAKLSTCVFVAREGADDRPFRVRAHPAHRIEAGWSAGLTITPSQLRRLDERNLAIPSCGDADWAVVEHVLARPAFRRLGEVVKSYQGEVSETAVKKKGGLLTRDASYPPVLRGANLTLYAVREASQGEVFFIDDVALLRGTGAGAKVRHAGGGRLGFQRSSPQNNFRRIIASPIAPDNYCFDTVSYVTEASSGIALDALLALLNSQLYEWWFRLTSSNSKVNEYQFNSLPWLRLEADPEAAEVVYLIDAGRWGDLTLRLQERVAAGLIPRWAERALAHLAREISAAESTRVLASRRERSRLGEEGTRLQRRVDQVVYALFGLGPEQQAHVEGRLREML